MVRLWFLVNFIGLLVVRGTIIWFDVGLVKLFNGLEDGSDTLYVVRPWFVLYF